MAPHDNDTTDAHLILDALYAGGELQIDWKEVAKAFNITLPGNATRKFQDILKKYGYKYDKGKNRLVKLDSSAAPVTPTKNTTGDNRTAEKAATKKRKLEVKTEESKDEAAGDENESG